MASSRFSACISASLMLCALVGAAGSAGGASIVASYGLGGTLAADQSGQFDLQVTDPLKMCHFETANVFGVDRQVWRFAGGTDPAEQGGLTYGGSPDGFVTPNSYSVELVMSFDVSNQWSRILDVQGRSTDSGFYVDPENLLDVYPEGGNGQEYTAGDFHHVVLTVSPLPNRGGAPNVLAYLDGHEQLAVTTDVMDIFIGHTINLFLDNNQAQAQDEYSNGRLALARFYDGALTGEEVKDLYDGIVPAPGAAGLLGMGGLIAARRRRA